MMLENELEKIGLTKKEAKVYFASIQLGPSSVQKIALKAKVNRATTYVVIDSLMEMGMMSTFDEGKKTFYVAGKPSRLVSYFQDKKQNIEDKIEEVKTIMPQLSVLYDKNISRPKVKYYEGVEGLKSVYADYTETLKNGGEFYTFLPLSEFEKVDLGSVVKTFRDERVGIRIDVKVIYTSSKGRNLAYEKSLKTLGDSVLYLEEDLLKDLPLESGFNIYQDKIFMFDYSGGKGGVLIENRAMADSLKLMFLIIWNKYFKKMGSPKM